MLGLYGSLSKAQDKILVANKIYRYNKLFIALLWGSKAKTENKKKDLAKLVCCIHIKCMDCLERNYHTMVIFNTNYSILH